MTYNYNVGKRFSAQRLLPVLFITLLYISWILWANYVDPAPRTESFSDYAIPIGDIVEVDGVDMGLRKGSIVRAEFTSGDGSGIYLAVTRDSYRPTADEIINPEQRGIWTHLVIDQIAELQVGDTTSMSLYFYHPGSATNDEVFDLSITIDEPTFASIDAYIIAIFFLSLVEIILLMANYSQIKYGYKLIKAKIKGKKFINEEIEVSASQQESQSDFEKAFETAFK